MFCFPTFANGAATSQHSFCEKHTSGAPGKQSIARDSLYGKDHRKMSSPSSFVDTSGSKLPTRRVSRAISLLKPNIKTESEIMELVKSVKKPRKSTKPKKPAIALSAVDSKKSKSSDFIRYSESSNDANMKVFDLRQKKNKSKDDSDTDFELNSLGYKKKTTTTMKAKQITRPKASSSSKNKGESVSHESKRRIVLSKSSVHSKKSKVTSNEPLDKKDATTYSQVLVPLRKSLRLSTSKYKVVQTGQSANATMETRYSV